VKLVEHLILIIIHHAKNVNRIEEKKNLKKDKRIIGKESKKARRNVKLVEHFVIKYGALIGKNHHANNVN